MDSADHIKLAAWQELQEALKIKRINDELLEYLVASLRWLLYYSEKNRITLPEKSKMIALLAQVMAIADKLPSPPKNKHPFKTPDDSTEHKFLYFILESPFKLEQSSISPQS